MSSGGTAADYAGDISVTEAWELLKNDPAAQIVDVRTAAEWNYVGLPDVSSLGKKVLTVEWQSFPSGTPNAAFVGEAVQALGNVTPDAAVVFLCRSGVRSRGAAIAMTRAGFQRAYNIAGGFEGDLDGERHRGQTNGWKAAGLPWKQS
ncbi:MAG TPA: rhodanese-like domain-containing protein [Rhizomicrobium sp.]|nr:rhodanese-like domain-containing protein [Rhizomicrobium sp.]